MRPNFCHTCSKFKGLIPSDQAVKRPSGFYLPALLVSEEDILTSPQRLCATCYESVKDMQVGNERWIIDIRQLWLNSIYLFQEELKLQLSPSFQKNIEAGSIVSIPAIHFRLEDEIEKAMALLELSKGKHDPVNFDNCYGLLFLTIIKGGMVFTGERNLSIAHIHLIYLIYLIMPLFMIKNYRLRKWIHRYLWLFWNILGRCGTGFVVSRLGNSNGVSNTSNGRYSSSADDYGSMSGWSAPSAITLVGLGWGFSIGGQIQHVCFILPNKTTVEAFRSSGQFQLGMHSILTPALFY